MRKLASIQKIIDIRPIENADAIEVARVLGWDVVVKKDEYHIGEDVVYVEIDAFLPLEDQYEFLRKSSYKNSPILGEGFRLKSVRLRGQISQGLILPISVVEDRGWHGLPEGTDVTELLGIRKWEEPEPAVMSADAIGRRPSWVIKSDETRVQSAPGLLEEFKGIPYYITTKYDGSSHFIGLDNEDAFHFGSHNLELKPINKENSFYNYIVEHNLEQKLRDVKQFLKCERIYVIGEWCGAGIQKNKLSLKKPAWFPFTVGVNDKRVSLDGMRHIINLLGIQMVEVEETGNDLTALYPTVDALIERAGENRKHVYPGECEGIVIRPIDGSIMSRILGKELSMKVINNKYLLKQK